MHRRGLAYQFDDVILDPGAFSVEKSGRPLSLEPKSIHVLLYLIRNRPRAVGKEELLRSVWEDVAVTDNALTRVVAQLRKALGDDAKVARYVETVPTIGYRFIAEVRELQDESAAPPPLPLPLPVAPPKPRRSMALAIALVAVALALLLAASRLFSPAPGPATWLGTLLGGSVIASHPRISPDGQLLAFRAIVDGQSQVAVMKPESSSWTALTHDRDKGAVAHVAWARDGSRIYFDREWGPGRIYTIGPLGGEPRLILENAWLPEPLPDGSLIAERPSSEGRQQLLHYWPDSGRTQSLPATVLFEDSPNFRPFPDGREVAVFGLPSHASGPPRLFTVNLQSLAITDLSRTLPAAEIFREPIAITPDGRSILIQRHREDTVETVAVPRTGSGAPRLLFSVPALTAPLSEDASPDGSLYMDHCQFERAVLNLSPSGVVNDEIPTPALSEVVRSLAAVALPGGSVVFNLRHRGRSELFLGRSGAEPQLLLNTSDSASLPGALLGTDNLAFIINPEHQPRLAIASLKEGRIIRRFTADAGGITAVSAPQDGQTIYYASSGSIWVQPVSGGDPHKIGEGYDLAVDPSGTFLYLMRTGPEGYQLFRMPAAGGEAVRVALPAGFNLTPVPLSPSAVDRAGRILVPVNLPAIFFFQTAIFDPAHNRMTAIPAPPRLVLTSAGWTPEGAITVRTGRWSSSLWQYRISLQNKAAR